MNYEFEQQPATSEIFHVLQIIRSEDHKLSVLLCGFQFFKKIIRCITNQLFFLKCGRGRRAEFRHFGGGSIEASKPSHKVAVVMNVITSNKA